MQVATTAALASGNYSATGGTGGTGAFTGAPASVDGITLAEGDRVLVKNQATASQNGIYKVVDSLNGIWDRATDFDAALRCTSILPRLRRAGRPTAARPSSGDGRVILNTSDVAFSEVTANPAVRVATTGNVWHGASTRPPRSPDVALDDHRRGDLGVK